MQANIIEKKDKPEFWLKMHRSNIILFFFSLVVLSLAIFGEKGLLEAMSLKSEAKKIKIYNTIVERKIRTTESKISKISNNKESLEKTARESLALQKDGEIIYLFE